MQPYYTINPVEAMIVNQAMRPAPIPVTAAIPAATVPPATPPPLPLQAPIPYGAPGGGGSGDNVGLEVDEFRAPETAATAPIVPSGEGEGRTVAALPPTKRSVSAVIAEAQEAGYTRAQIEDAIKAVREATPNLPELFGKPQGLWPTLIDYALFRGAKTIEAERRTQGVRERLLEQKLIPQERVSEAIGTPYAVGYMKFLPHQVRDPKTIPAEEVIDRASVQWQPLPGGVEVGTTALDLSPAQFKAFLEGSPRDPWNRPIPGIDIVLNPSARLTPAQSDIRRRVAQAGVEREFAPPRQGPAVPADLQEAFTKLPALIEQWGDQHGLPGLTMTDFSHIPADARVALLAQAFSKTMPSPVPGSAAARKLAAEADIEQAKSYGMAELLRLQNEERAANTALTWEKVRGQQWANKYDEKTFGDRQFLVQQQGKHEEQLAALTKAQIGFGKDKIEVMQAQIDNATKLKELADRMGDLKAAGFTLRGVEIVHKALITLLEKQPSLISNTQWLSLWNKANALLPVPFKTGTEGILDKDITIEQAPPGIPPTVHTPEVKPPEGKFRHDINEALKHLGHLRSKEIQDEYGRITK